MGVSVSEEVEGEGPFIQVHTPQCTLSASTVASHLVGPCLLNLHNYGEFR